MTSELSNRIEDATELVNRDSVKKYLIDGKIERWVVVGNSREYLVFIEPYWCRCYDFQHSALNNQVMQCKHSLAVQIALKKHKYETIRLNSNEYDFIRPGFLL